MPKYQFWKYLLSLLEGEEVEAIMISGFEKLLSLEEARKHLSYLVRRHQCPLIYVWTTTRVFHVSEYDGNQWLTWVPRNPVIEEPTACGA